MCLYPRLIRNPKYKANKKNGGNVPYMKDSRVASVPIGCGECIECCKQKANNWRVRLQEDIKDYKEMKFVTLTFSNESYRELYNLTEGDGYIRDNKIAALAVRRFLERWRKKYKKSLRHWLITELGHGKTEHLHLHGIVYTNELKEVENIWSYGWVWKGYEKSGKIENYVNEKTINYIVKYVTKKDLKHKTYIPIILCSAGIGAGYVNRHNFKNNKYNGDETNTKYRTNTGTEIQLPIYYRNKAYNEEEREKLWLMMLDRKERFVCGEKIDTSKGYKNYYKLLKYYQDINIRLGYGKGEKKWRLEEYEKERRNLKQKQRVSPTGFSRILDQGAIRQ